MSNWRPGNILEPRVRIVSLAGDALAIRATLVVDTLMREQIAHRAPY